MQLKLPSSIFRRGRKEEPELPECILAVRTAFHFEATLSAQSGRSNRSLGTNEGSLPELSAQVSVNSLGSGTLLGSGSLQRKSLVLQHDRLAQQQLSDAYEVDSAVIGRGGFGTVRIARLREAPSTIRAIKTVLKRSLKAEHLVRREIKILRNLDHPSICRLFETFEDEQAIYLVLEFIDGVELFDQIVESGHLDELQAARIMRQIFGALQYCHAHMVIHRDLKPDNVMVQRHSQEGCEAVPDDRTPLDQEVKLIDFGLAVNSNRSHRSRSGSVMGTEDYLAPEARDGGCVPASDLWSAGMILHALLLGSLPPTSVIDGEEAINLTLPIYAGFSAPAKDLLARLLKVDPAMRINAEGAAAHAWTLYPMQVHSLPKDFTTVMRAFTSFHRSAKLRRAVVTAVAMQLTNRQLSSLREQFLQADADGNGRISKEELAASVLVAEPHQDAEDVRTWVDTIFDSIDMDGSKEIEYTEWLAAAAHEGELRSEEAIRAAFRVFDTDGDGRIDQDELRRVFRSSREEIAILLPEFDSNGDGVLDFQEFRSIVLSPIPSQPGSGDTSPYSTRISL